MRVLKDGRSAEKLYQRAIRMARLADSSALPSCVWRTAAAQPPSCCPLCATLQGYADLSLNQLSGTNPFIGNATYEASGRHEAARLAAAAAATGGLDLWQSAAAVWRKKVAQGWAPQLQQLLTTHGIG